jgi:hypothetical protein
MSTITLAELLAVQSVIVTKEAADKVTLEPLTKLVASHDLLRPLLVQWATGGFSTTTSIQSYEVTAPTTCADGTKRALCEYIEYLLGTTMGALVTQLTALAPEVVFSYAFPGDAALAIFATRGPVVPAPEVPVVPAPEVPVVPAPEVPVAPPA